MYSFIRKVQCSAAFSILLLSACQTVTVTPAPTPVLPEPQAIVYTIKKGEHNSGSSFAIRKVTSLKFEATFNATAIYQTINQENQGDINKLYGVSDCMSDHHSNSARFGWRWYKDQLEVHAYTYKNKERQSKLIGVVELNKPYSYEIELLDNMYRFILNGTAIELPRNCNGIGEGYQLYPYFGGDEKAPHDITISIRETE